MFGLFTSRCQVCGTPFKRKRYRWTIRDKKAWVCPRCNSELEKRASSAAFGREVNWPKIREESGCGSLGCLSIIVGLAGASLFGSLIKRAVPEPTIPSPPASNTSVLMQSVLVQQSTVVLSKIPIFRLPEKAARLPLNLGLIDTAPNGGVWRRGGEANWYALSKMVFTNDNSVLASALNNEITCLHSSKSNAYVEYVRWTANVFNEADASIIMPQFKKLCLDYCNQIGCPIPSELFMNVDPSKGQKLETEEAKFGLKKMVYKTGYGWELIVEAK